MNEIKAHIIHEIPLETVSPNMADLLMIPKPAMIEITELIRYAFGIAHLDLSSVSETCGFIGVFVGDPSPSFDGDFEVFAYSLTDMFKRPGLIGPYLVIDIWAVRGKAKDRHDFVLKRNDGTVACDSVTAKSAPRIDTPYGVSPPDFFAIMVPLAPEQWATAKNLLEQQTHVGNRD